MHDANKLPRPLPFNPTPGHQLLLIFGIAAILAGATAAIWKVPAIGAPFGITGILAIGIAAIWRCMCFHWKNHEIYEEADSSTTNSQNEGETP